MKVGLRAEASVEVGTGHVMRCRALADALRERGAQADFVESPEGVDWLVVDHYGLDERWEGAARRKAKLLAIDDLGRRHDCDILVDQNFFSDPAARYAGRVPERCRRLLGPRYAMLRKEFAQARKRERDGRVKKVLVSLGGTDPRNATSQALQLLNGRPFQVDVVVGSANPNKAEIARQCQVMGFRFHEQATNMAELMDAADLAVGAGGTTTWERACMGLPTLQLVLADNQEAPTRALADAGLVFYGGPSLTEAALEQALAKPEALAQQSQRMRELVDGHGARRVAAALLASPASGISLRQAEKADARLYFEWANDPEVRRQSIESRSIAWPEHEAWFAQRLGDSLLLVAQDEGGVPVGQVRFERRDPRWRVNYSIGEEFRGAGLAAKMLGAAIAELRRREPRAKLSAEVKPGNVASRRVFARLGFKEASATMYEQDA
jgi:UDP-2,4-diacetamido-2,4,6-trideoxy-beta-L-altropyranose hydrolase